MHPTIALSENLVLPIIALGGSFVCVIVGVVLGTVRSVLNARARESTKRELAAYVAEGSMTPEDAERILKAGPKEKSICGA